MVAQVIVFCQTYIIFVLMAVLVVILNREVFENRVPEYHYNRRQIEPLHIITVALKESWVSEFCHWHCNIKVFPECWPSSFSLDRLSLG